MTAENRTSEKQETYRQLAGNDVNNTQHWYHYYQLLSLSPHHLQLSITTNAQSKLNNTNLYWHTEFISHFQLDSQIAE